MTKRALAYIRISKLTDTTTSPERQRETTRDKITRQGWEFVGYVEDIDVSATKHRLDRPGIQELRRRIQRGEADLVVVARLDRIARNVADVSALLDEGIAIVSATEEFDTATAQGKAMAQMAQVFAELEATTIGLRVQSSRKYLPTVGRWPGGPTPYGFTTAPADSGSGRVLVHDPAEAAVVRRIVEEVLAGASVLEVTKRLNEDGIQPRRGQAWSRTVVARMLRSGAIRGHATTGGAKSPGKHRETGKALPQKSGDVVRDERGLPLIVWPPLVTPEEGRELDRLLRSGESRPRTLHSDSLLLAGGLAICSSCGKAMTARAAHRPVKGDAEKRLVLYVCQTRGSGGQCERPQTISAHLADEAAEAAFLSAYGHVEVLETVTEAAEPGDLADVRKAIAETSEAMRGDGDVMALAERMLALRAERERLEALPQTREVRRRTGQTYADLWEDSDIAGRRALMLSAEAYARILPAPRRGKFDPERVDVLDHLAGQFD